MTVHASPCFLLHVSMYKSSFFICQHDLAFARPLRRGVFPDRCVSSFSTFRKTCRRSAWNTATPPAEWATGAMAPCAWRAVAEAPVEAAAAAAAAAAAPPASSQQLPASTAPAAASCRWCCPSPFLLFPPDILSSRYFFAVCALPVLRPGLRIRESQRTAWHRPWGLLRRFQTLKEDTCVHWAVCHSRARPHGPRALRKGKCSHVMLNITCVVWVDSH